jgi:zinc protease
MTREDPESFHATWFRPNNATLIVVGNTSLAEIKPKLEKLFAAWEPGAVPQRNLAEVPRPGKPTIYLLDKPGALHSVVIAGTVVGPPDAKNEVALETMNNVFGGTFGARLNMNLREDKHWSYGAGSVLYGARAQRPFLAYASVQVDKTAAAISEILAEMNGMLGERPIEPAELEKTIQQQIFELPGSNETMNSIGGLFSDLLESNLPLDFFDTYVSQVSALRIPDIEAAAHTVIDPNQTIWMVVADRNQVEKDLRQLNVGEIVILPA